MKQLRSRIRLITLLLACCFLLAAALCAGTVLKSAGIRLPSVSSLSGVVEGLNGNPSPDPSASPDASPEDSVTPAPPDAEATDSGIPGTDNSPDPEYNVFGL